ncbi:hypothetical protein ACFWIJ_06500 [Streptomyces sp. NPDC127079]|uniref:hypothetical protein n=1 Tax=Streptomyces sp. NPDC127079 TaxID=3347132 RepID=UPI00365BC99E
MAGDLAGGSGIHRTTVTRRVREDVGPLAADDRGRLLWISAGRPGRTSEITACRHDELTRKLRDVGLGAVADLGFGGLDDSGPDADPAAITGYKATRNRPLVASAAEPGKRPGRPVRRSSPWASSPEVSAFPALCVGAFSYHSLDRWTDLRCENY